MSSAGSRCELGGVGWGGVCGGVGVVCREQVRLLCDSRSIRVECCKEVRQPGCQAARLPTHMPITIQGWVTVGQEAVCVQRMEDLACSAVWHVA
jgi:hypothetical protein